MHLVAVLPEKTATATAFLDSSGVGTDNVLSMAPLEVGVQMVPTLLLLDENGKLERYWVGEMNQEREREGAGGVDSVLQRLPPFSNQHAVTWPNTGVLLEKKQEKT